MQAEHHYSRQQSRLLPPVWDPHRPDPGNKPASLLLLLFAFFSPSSSCCSTHVHDIQPKACQSFGHALQSWEENTQLHWPPPFSHNQQIYGWSVRTFPKPTSHTELITNSTLSITQTSCRRLTSIPRLPSYTQSPQTYLITETICGCKAVGNHGNLTPQLPPPGPPSALALHNLHVWPTPVHHFLSLTLRLSHLLSQDSFLLCQRTSSGTPASHQISVIKQTEEKDYWRWKLSTCVILKKEKKRPTGSQQ